VGDVLGTTLASIHNIHWFQNYMSNMRQSILDGTFEAFRKWVWEIYPEKPPQKPKKSGNRKRK
jgi:tRNA-guanine family transglycosylase